MAVSYTHLPDRNHEPGAEDKFKEINEAYEVLSDEKKRATYDQFGHAGMDLSLIHILKHMIQVY